MVVDGARPTDLDLLSGGVLAEVEHRLNVVSERHSADPHATAVNVEPADDPRREVDHVLEVRFVNASRGVQHENDVSAVDALCTHAHTGLRRRNDRLLH